MNAALGFRLRHTLYAVSAALVAQRLQPVAEGGAALLGMGVADLAKIKVVKKRV